MIDLKKENSQDYSLNNNSFDSKANNSLNNKTGRQIKEQNAKKFLCVMLSLIVVFVSVVCLFINKRNEMLLAEQKIHKLENSSNTADAADSKTGDSASNTADNPQNGEVVDSTKKETDAASVQAIKPPKPGTPENPTIIEIDENNWEMTLVNSCYRISADYEPNLVYVCDGDQRLDKNVAIAYEKMFRAGLKDGVTLTPASGYRSFERQERNFNRKINYYLSQGLSEADAKAKAMTVIMPPGSSEHNLGYAMDIVCVEEWFKNTAEYKWLLKNAQDYGFIQRYTEDKQDITKVIYEPWHWRYVGVENAKKIKDSGLCLEEYLGVAE